VGRKTTSTQQKRANTIGVSGCRDFSRPLIFAQSTPQVTGVEPQSGKVNDTVTVSGQNLGKDAVSAVFLSDDKNDYKATVVEQTAEKIVMKNSSGQTCQLQCFDSGGRQTFYQARAIHGRAINHEPVSFRGCGPAREIGDRQNHHR